MFADVFSTLVKRVQDRDRDNELFVCVTLSPYLVLAIHLPENTLLSVPFWGFLNEIY